MANDKDFKVKNGIQPTVYHEGVGTVVSGSEGYYLAGASYDSKSFSVNAQEGSPEGLYFKSDGTKVYVVGSSGDSVDQFSLSTAWDISTASFDSVTFSLASQVTTPKGVFFKPDGTSFYVQGQSVADRYVYQYNMTTAWNISTASYASKSFSTSEDNEPLGVFFKPDGTKAFVTGEQNDKVYQYGLSTAWDASTGSYDSVSFDFSATANYVHGLAFSSDGTKLFLAGYNAEYKIFSYSLSTAWDLTTASYVTSFSINSQETDNKDVQFSTDGTKMYIVGATNDTIFQYSTVP
jgi:DNA-binding beta-propeller fold protein YncE